ncbi:hypothetical protein [Planktothrix mougeotii]|uniref:Uncharacterized protein n=1 Tax=Planktothrix mougeotii LEGE 06226 TaxID=1828728 RepID=A0ABR9U6R5_9CYAN|nr:hypothetical protein [Planktothrix mougeotii]MBE9142149.1 hypothetical protein [Planktothrix mougeotii LEGE 06226]
MSSGKFCINKAPISKKSKKIILTLLTYFSVITYSSVEINIQKALADDGFNLSEPNAAPCSPQGFNLSQENVCSDKVSLENTTGIGIYYDFGTTQDQYLPNNETWIWTLKGSNRSTRVVVIDENINVPGIQEKRYNVYSGKNYIFRLENNKIILYNK